MAEEKTGFIGRSVNFFGEVKQELRKVSWPTRSELQGATIVVITVTIVLSLFLGLGDAIFGSIIEFVMSKKS